MEYRGEVETGVIDLGDSNIDVTVKDPGVRAPKKNKILVLTFKVVKDEHTILVFLS